MRPLSVTLALLILASFCFAQDTPALDSLKADMNTIRAASGAGLMVSGILIAAYGMLQYQDARDLADQVESAGGDRPPTGRHLLVAGAGTVMSICGVVCLWPWFGSSMEPYDSRQPRNPDPKGW